MIAWKYKVHITGVGLSVMLILYSTTCNPLPTSFITQIAQQYINSSCVIQSYSIEIPELPQMTHSVPLLDVTTYGTASLNSSASVSGVTLSGTTNIS